MYSDLSSQPSLQAVKLHSEVLYELFFSFFFLFLFVGVLNAQCVGAVQTEWHALIKATQASKCGKKVPALSLESRIVSECHLGGNEAATYFFCISSNLFFVFSDAFCFTEFQ